jgi:hypothetical protein
LRTTPADWLNFPEAATDEDIVEMPHMREAAKRTLAVHQLGAFVVWSGQSRVGKSTTAKWLRDELNRRYDDDPTNQNAFRTLYFEEGEVRSRDADELRLAIRTVYQHAVGRLDRGVLLYEPTQSLAQQTVAGLEREKIRLVLVDEAGLWSVGALRGLVLLRNLAETLNWKTTFVLIGMDGLPFHLESAPQIIGRVVEWISFEPYSVDDTWELLRGLHPHFAGLDPDKRSDRQQVEWVWKTHDGIAGRIVSYVQRFRRRYDERDGYEVDLAFLQEAQRVTDDDIRRIYQVNQNSAKRARKRKAEQ